MATEKLEAVLNNEGKNIHAFNVRFTPVGCEAIVEKVLYYEIHRLENGSFMYKLIPGQNVH